MNTPDYFDDPNEPTEDAFEETGEQAARRLVLNPTEEERDTWVGSGDQIMRYLKYPSPKLREELANNLYTAMVKKAIEKAYGFLPPSTRTQERAEALAKDTVQAIFAKERLTVNLQHIADVRAEPTAVGAQYGELKDNAVTAYIVAGITNHLIDCKRKGKNWVENDIVRPSNNHGDAPDVDGDSGRAANIHNTGVMSDTEDMNSFWQEAQDAVDDIIKTMPIELRAVLERTFDRDDKKPKPKELAAELKIEERLYKTRYAAGRKKITKTMLDLFPNMRQAKLLRTLTHEEMRAVLQDFNNPVSVDNPSAHKENARILGLHLVRQYRPRLQAAHALLKLLAEPKKDSDKPRKPRKPRAKRPPKDTLA